MSAEKYDYRIMPLFQGVDRTGEEVTGCSTEAAIFAAAFEQFHSGVPVTGHPRRVDQVRIELPTHLEGTYDRRDVMEKKEAYKSGAALATA